MLTRSESWDKLLLPPDILQVPQVVTNFKPGHHRNPSELSHVFSHNETQLLEELEYLEHANKSLENEVENLTMSEKSLQRKLRDAKLELEMLTERVEIVKSEKKAVEIERDKQKKSSRKQKKKIQELQRKKDDIEKELKMYEELQTIRRQEFEMLQLPKSGYTSPKSMSEADEPITPSPSSTKSRVNLTGSLQTFKNQAAALEEKIDEQKGEIEEKDKTIKRLKNKINEHGQPHEIIRALNLELKETKDQCSKLKGELKEGRKAEEYLLADLGRHKKQLNELQEYQKSSIDSLFSMETEVKEMKEKLGETKNECLKGECAHAIILENARKEKSQKLESIKMEVSTKEQEINGLRENLAILERKLAKCSNAAKRVKIMNEISQLQSDQMELEMNMDIIRSVQLNFTLNLIDADCLGCQHLEDENQRIRGQRAEFQYNLMTVKIQLAEAEAELKEYS